MLNYLRVKKNNYYRLQEENLPTNFVPLTENNVIVEPYTKSYITHYIYVREPDLFLDFSKSSFKEKRNFTVDLKTDAGLGRNQYWLKYL
jgi:hypothetical protein